MIDNFSLRQSGKIGQEIISPSGKVLAWTTDPVFGAFLIRILNEHLSVTDPVKAIFEEEATNGK